MERKDNKQCAIDVLEYMRSLDTVKMEKANVVTFSEWTNHWLNNYCKSIKETTLIQYRAVVEHHLDRVLGRLKLAEITKEDVQYFVNSLSLGVGIEETLSAKSIHNIHGILHKCLEIAAQNGYINENPAKYSVLPKVEKTEIRPLNSEQLITFFNGIKGTPKEMLYKFTIYTGFRAGEILGLTWDCINFEQKNIRIYRQLVRKVNDNGIYIYEFGSLKNSRPRTIYPPQTVFDILEGLKKVKKYSCDFVFINNRGTHYTHSAIYNSFVKIMKKLDLSGFRFHDLRHTYAVLSLQAGIDIKTLQYNLGHHSAAFTLDVYGHCLDEMRKRGAEQLGEYMKKYE